MAVEIKLRMKRQIGGNFEITGPPPEVPETVNKEEVGNLGLTDDEVDAIVAFLNTLSDQPIEIDKP